jgi:LDH2 family malate/lactate/ureidoglycolate dehydrogenase
VLIALGAREADARDMAAQIVNSELSGHESHGLRRLVEYVSRTKDGYANPTASPTIDLDCGALVRMNGHAGFGHIVMRDATKLAVSRAKEHGIAAVAVHNSEFAGRFADFCEQAAEAGVATLVFVNDSGSGRDVAPPGALEGRMSSNPLAAGVPRAQAPHLVIDMATSAVAVGRLSEWRDRGEPIPADWVNEHGILQFFAGAKGFGLALIVEALAGALTTAGTVSEQKSPELQGAFLIAIDVNRLRPLADFTTEVEQFIRYIKQVPVPPDATPVRVPGEGSAQSARLRRETGTPIQPFTWAAIQRLAEEFNVAAPVPTS